MAKLTQPEFEFSPEGIAALCTDLAAYHRNMLIDWLEWAWDEEEIEKVIEEASSSDYDNLIKTLMDHSE